MLKRVSKFQFQVGDFVEIDKDLPDFVIDTMQAAFSLSGQGLKVVRFVVASKL